MLLIETNANSKYRNLNDRKRNKTGKTVLKTISKQILLLAVFDLVRIPSLGLKISSPFTRISCSRLSFVLMPCCSSLQRATVLREEERPGQTLPALLTTLTQLSSTLPDFSLVLPIEKVLSVHPLRHDELQGWLPCGARQTAQELEQGLHLRVHQVSKHHDQGLEREQEREGERASKRE